MSLSGLTSPRTRELTVRLMDDMWPPTMPAGGWPALWAAVLDTVAMAVLRTEVDSQLEQMIDAPARGVALPSAGSWNRPATSAVYRSENPDADM